MTPSRRRLALPALLAAALLGGCDGTVTEEAVPVAEAPQSQAPEPAAPAAPAGSDPAEEGTVTAPREDDLLPGPPQAVADWNAGIVEAQAAEMSPESPLPTLSDVRFQEHDGYDRVTFDFGFGPRPGVHVEYVDRPVRDCGSGEPRQVAGDGWLEIRFEPAVAHTEEGQPTAPSGQAVDLAVVREGVRTCDFEGVVTWVLGVASPNRYRVSVTERPVAVLVDVRHDRIAAGGP